MIGTLMILDPRGDVLISKTFRDVLSVRGLAEIFRNELLITGQVDRAPINVLKNLCFVHLKLSDLFVVMVSNANVNCLVAVQYGIRLVQMLASCFKVVTEDKIKDNFVTIIQMIEESVDFGYPQLTCAEAFAEMLPPEEGMNTALFKSVPSATGVAAKLTGPFPYRKEGLVYRVNELFVDVFEEINLLMSPTGEVLKREVTGRIVVNNFLSGMPLCKLSLNANIFGNLPNFIMYKHDAESDRRDAGHNNSNNNNVSGQPSNNDNNSSSNLNNDPANPNIEGEDGVMAGGPNSTNVTLFSDNTNIVNVESGSGALSSFVDPTVKLNDVSFHSCVRLNKFNEGQRIEFIPPDGEMILMRYRSQMEVAPPLTIKDVKVEEFSKTRVTIEFRLVCNAEDHHFNYTNIEARVPCPDNTSATKIKVTRGSAKYEPRDGVILWKLPSVRAGEELSFEVEIRQIASTGEAQEKIWSRPPISLDFKCVSKSLTGLKINELKVEENVFMYDSNKWVRYTTQAGEYKCRI